MSATTEAPTPRSLPRKPHTHPCTHCLHPPALNAHADAPSASAPKLMRTSARVTCVEGRRNVGQKTGGVGSWNNKKLRPRRQEDGGDERTAGGREYWSARGRTGGSGSKKAGGAGVVRRHGEGFNQSVGAAGGRPAQWPPLARTPIPPIHCRGRPPRKGGPPRMEAASEWTAASEEGRHLGLKRPGGTAASASEECLGLRRGDSRLRRDSCPLRRRPPPRPPRPPP